MRRNILIYILGTVTGVALTLAGQRFLRPPHDRRAGPFVTSSVCYSCFWEGYDAHTRSELVEFYRQFRSEDPLVRSDVRYILWRSTGVPNCDMRQDYRDVAANDIDPERRYIAYSILAFGAPECGELPGPYWQGAAAAASRLGLAVEASLLSALAKEGKLVPRFEPVKIETGLTVPPGAHTLVLGQSRIELGGLAVIGAQVDRVARDWMSYQLKWKLDESPLQPIPIDYHEGAAVKTIADLLPVRVMPLAGAIIARHDDKWFAPDDQGVFRFEVLRDKVRYPTTHVAGDFGWIEDTHGISALVPQAIEKKVQLVIGCGDAVGKAEASFYLAQKGIHVLFPGDRYADLLLGYKGKGVLMGGAPIRREGANVVIGGQPIRFSLAEPIIVEDTRKPFPIQYYDAPARYFRRLSQSVPLDLTFAEVDAPDQLERVLKVAAQKYATAVAVRVMTETEDKALREWLSRSPRHRALLFHSGLYPYAQRLFLDFPRQVTFGDLHPGFE
jgi:hypothetical protein